MVILGLVLLACTLKKEAMPERYGGLITQEEYDIVLQYSLNFLKEKGAIQKVDDGVIDVQLHGDSSTNRLALDNLLRYCKQEADKTKWKEMIIDHFTRVTKSTTFDASDFNNCRDLLAVRIYPEYEDKIKQIMVFKVDFPGTMSALALDMPDRYEPIDQETVDLWKVPIDSLFRIAQQNVNKREGIEILEKNDGTPGKLYTFLSIDHSASYIRDIETNAPFTIGKFGAFVSVPTTGTAFAIPIDDKSSVTVLNSLKPKISSLFNEDPGNITMEIFWYRKGKYMLVPAINDDLVLPKELEESILH